MYRAYNILGWGQFSDPVDIIAAQSPSTPATVVV